MINCTQYKMQPDKLWRLDVGILRADTSKGADEIPGFCDAYLASK